MARTTMEAYNMVGSIEHMKAQRLVAKVCMKTGLPPAEVAQRIQQLADTGECDA